MSFCLVALTEELCKFLAVRSFAYRKKSFDEPLDGIVYCVVASMGFATVENIVYVETHGWFTGVMRMFLSVPAHATFGVIMGYHLGRAKFHPGKKTRMIFMGLFWAVFFHGLFDALLFLRVSPQVNHQSMDFLLFAGAVLSFMIALGLAFRQIEKHRRLSQQTYAPTISLSLHKAFVNDIPLIMDLAKKIWPQTYAPILTPEQSGYMMDKMYSADALRAQMQEQHHEFVIVRDAGLPVGFASFNKIGENKFKLQKIYILSSQRGKGTGRFVIEQLSRAMVSHGGKFLSLNVNRNNPAKDFYEKLGFNVVGEEDIDIGNGFFMNDYVMEKSLA
jgi:ribosomal protein S18 acetylase RimI-like enzyme